MQDRPANTTNLPEGQWIKNELGLYLPSSYAQKAKNQPLPRMFDFAVLTVEWSALTGWPPTIDDVLVRLRRYSLREIVSLVTRLTLTLALADNKAGIVDPLTQDRLLSNMLGDNAMRNLWSALLKNPDYERERTVWFNERQLLNTLKLAFIAIDHDASQPKHDAATNRFLPFVEALLMVSELMDSPEARTKEAAAAEADKLELYAYANVLFNAEGDAVREIVRSHYFYLEPHPEITSRPGLVDFPQLLSQMTGLTAERTWAALFVLYGAFLIRTHDDIDAGRVAVSRSDYLRDISNLKPEEADRWFSLGTLSSEEMQSAVRAEYSVDAPNWFDLLVFEIHPLVAFDDDVLCLSMPLLQKLETTSLWYRLIHPDVPESTRLAALDTRGRLLEAYVTEVLRRAFKAKYFDESVLNKCINPGKKPKQRLCDGMVVLDDTLFLFEVKETSVSLAARQATSFAVYRDKRVKLVDSAASQLEATARHLRAGKFAPLGIDSSNIKHIIPIIVSMDQPVTPTLYRSIRERDLAGNPLNEAIRTGKVEPLQLTNVADLELLEITVEAGVDVGQLLLSKGRSVDEVGLAFNQYCHGRVDFERAPKHGSWYGQRYHELMEAVTLELRAAGLPTSATELEELSE